MKSSAALPVRDEAARLAAVDRYDVPEGDPELNDITGLAAQVLGTPVALVSLVGADRQWFRSRFGAAMRDTPRSVSFCIHAIEQGTLLEVTDATQDPRFAANPLVTGHPRIRFYAGVPLVTPTGEGLGTLCVVDFRPRTLDAQQREALERLARLAMSRLELLLANQRISAKQACLGQQQAFMEQAMETSLEGIVVQDADGRVLRYNRAAETLLGHSRADAIGKPLWDFAVPERFRDRFRRGFQDQFAAGVDVSGYRHELVALRADGKETYIECVSSLTHHPDGDRLVTFFHDISSHKELKRLHQQLDALVKAFPEVFTYYDAADRLVMANNLALARQGVGSQVHNVGRPFESVVRDAVRQGVFADAIGREEAWIEERLAAHRSYGTMEIRLSNGRWLQLVQSRTSDGGRICVYIDVTDMQQRRRELEAALAQAKAAAQAKSEFVATVSHEIRTPLNALIGLSDVLAESRLDAQQQTWVRTMQSSGRHLLQLVSDVLDFSQLQSNQVTPVDEAFELRPALDELMATAAALPGAANLDFGTSVADEVPAAIRGDRHRLLQVLTNLVGNAVKFTLAGRVRLGAWIEQRDGDGTLCLEVADSGPGIPAALAEKIFEDFVQADMPGQPLRSGTGLGLAIARRLTLAMGGTLALANPGEAGARFVLRLPCRPATVQQPAAVAPVPRSAVSRHVLVAEDTPASQMVLRLLLEGLGHTVEIVDDGPAAVEAFAGGGFDTVLLDLQLPGMDGCAVAQALRAGEAAKRGDRATLVAVSAFSQPRDRERALTSGMDAYLAKPVRLRDLAALFDSFDSAGRQLRKAPH